VLGQDESSEGQIRQEFGGQSEQKDIVVLPLEGGGTIEVGTVGNEGMLLIALVLGDTVANSESMPTAARTGLAPSPYPSV
jgi:hypothetical protein